MARARDGVRPEVAVPRAVFIVIVVAMLLFGLMMVYSASSVRALTLFGNGAYYFTRQIAFVGAGVVIAYLISRFDYRRARGPIAWVLWGICTAALLVTTFLGKVGIFGAQRWLDLGFVTLQPSEFAKLACIVLVAALMCDWHEHIIDDRQFLARTMFAILPVMGLIIVQPDLGTTALLAITMGTLLLLGGVEGKYLGFGFGGMAAAVAILAVAAPYRFKRLLALNPWKYPDTIGYQAINGFYAFASGGLTGVGLGLSRQKYAYLPAAHTDFIFAIIGEELGLAGTLSVIAAFIILTWAGFQIARHAPDRFGRLIASTATVAIAAQALVNIMCVIGLLPITGKPLPFISAGGSSMSATMIAVGMILSVSMHSDLKSRADRRRGQMRVVEGSRR